uniref:Uncharacterized protein n=1 Tax=Caenorhabditis japonica TaxID=281687 RepID=A0A8R1EQQ3_CAEJA
MSVRQAEKDVEVEVGHVEEKNAVVEVVESVTGGESEERLGVERKRQREGIIGPLKKFASELLERFEEMGADRWPQSVLRVMKDFDLENVQEIRQVCEKVFGEACSEANASKDAEKVDEIDRKYQKLKIKLNDCQIMWEVERENLLEELENIDTAWLTYVREGGRKMRLRSIGQRKSTRFSNVLWIETQFGNRHRSAGW